jgi:hypothetical protein
MQTYWDLTNRERSDLDREGVEKFLDAELMAKGVLKVDPPELEPVPKVPELPRKPFVKLEWADPEYSYSKFSVDIVFDTAEQAQAFLDLKPRRLRSRHREQYYTEVLADPSFIVVQACGQQEYLEAKSAIEAAGAVSSRNSSASSKYEKACAEMNKVLQGVWSDWSECRDMAAQHQRVFDTREEYQRIADDDSVAMQFLRKAFGDEQIQEAFAWFEMDAPDFDPPPEAAGEAKGVSDGSHH